MGPWWTERREEAALYWRAEEGSFEDNGYLRRTGGIWLFEGRLFEDGPFESRGGRSSLCRQQGHNIGSKKGTERKESGFRFSESDV